MEIPKVSLADLANRHISNRGIDFVREGRACRAIASILGNGDAAASFIAATFWDFYTNTRFYPFSPEYVVPGGLRAPPSREVVVCHGTPHPRFDLAVIVSFTSDEYRHYRVNTPRVHTVSTNTREINLEREWRSQEWGRSYRRRINRPVLFGELSVEVVGAAIAEMGMMLDPQMMFLAPAPARPQALIGTQPLDIHDRSSEKSSLAGVVAEREDGLIGVTGALHAIEGDCVAVFGHEGRRLEADVISDSCFLSRPACSLPLRDVGGPLQRFPYGHESVHFLNARRQRIKTVVTGWDKKLFYSDPQLQRCIYTAPVTSDGDSGAALLNESDSVAGFCFGRAGIDDPDPDSIWIWADSVYDALRLRKD